MSVFYILILLFSNESICISIVTKKLRRLKWGKNLTVVFWKGSQLFFQQRCVFCLFEGTKMRCSHSVCRQLARDICDCFNVTSHHSSLEWSPHSRNNILINHPLTGGFMGLPPPALQLQLCCSCQNTSQSPFTPAWVSVCQMNSKIAVLLSIK